jgi:hypothetical protein
MRSFGPLMEIIEIDFAYEVSEIKECGLTEVKANPVKRAQMNGDWNY